MVGQPALALRPVGALGVVGGTLLLLGGCTTVEPDPCPLTIWCSFTLLVCDDSPEPAVVSGSGACQDATFSCEGDELCRESCVFANRGGICKVEVTVGSNRYSTQVELVETRKCYSKYSPAGGFTTVQVGENCADQ